MTTLKASLPAIPDLDEELIRSASMTAADGSSIHSVNTEIGIYRNALAGAKRLTDLIRTHGPRPDDAEEMARRLAAAEKYRILLHQRVVAARLARI